MASGWDEAAASPRREETRRALLAKAGLVGGGLGLGALVRADGAFATHPFPPLPQPDSGRVTVSNVKDWGALGNDSHDDRPYIQQCINDSAGKAAVYFPPGTYVCEGPLSLPSSTFVFGEGPLSVIKAGTNNTSHIFYNADLNGGNDDIRIENLKLDGNAPNRTSSGWELIRIAGALQSVNGGDGYCGRIFIRGVEGLRAKGGGFGVLLANVRVVMVQDCYFHDCDNDGIHVQGDSSDVVFQGNIVKECGDDHIAVTEDHPTGQPLRSPQRVTIVGNVCQWTDSNMAYTGAGIAVRGGKQVEITGNVCRGFPSAGILVVSYMDAVEDVDVSHNVVREAGKAPRGPASGDGNGTGILVSSPQYQMTRVNVHGNVISAPRYHGVTLSLPTTYSSAGLTDISVTDNLVWFDPSSSATKDPQANGVACLIDSWVSKDVADIRISRNEIRNAQDSGIKVTGTKNRRFDIQGNTVTDSGQASSSSSKSGIYVDGVNGITIVGNRAQDTRSSGKTQNYGLTIANAAGDVLISDNVLTDNAASSPVNFSNGSGISRLNIRDNPGWKPWTGHADFPAGTALSPTIIGGSTFKWVEIAVQLNPAFPVAPKVLLTTGSQGYAASAANVSTNQFGCRLWLPPVKTAPSALPSTVTVYWSAEPAS